MAPPRASRAKGQRASEPGGRVVPQLPDACMHTMLMCLSQAQRVRTAEVCRAWREATLSPPLWTSLKFVLPCDDDEGTAESFLSWLLPRSSGVRSLHIDIQDAAAPTSEFVATVMSSLVAAVMAVRDTVMHLTIETAGCLVLGQWAAALSQLRSGVFIGGEVHVRPGLGKLRNLRDLEFGSNNAELEIEEAAALPPCVTHLSLEHCCLAAVPPCITRLSQLRSLDLSQNTFGDDDGDETATLSRLTALECLKLANCRMPQVPPELSALRRLRILHMGGNLEGEEAEAEAAERLDATLRPLRNLQVLVVSQCNVVLPEAVRRMTRLERLFVTSTPVTALAPGPYCKSLLHLCLDWDVAFESASMLEACSSIQMLTLARPHRADVPDGQSEERAAALSGALLRHPTLQQVNIVAVQGRGLHLSIHTMRFVLALRSAAGRRPPLRLELIDSWDDQLVRIPSLQDYAGGAEGGACARGAGGA